MVADAAGGVDVVLLQQRQRLIHRGRPVQQQADGGGDGQIRLSGGGDGHTALIDLQICYAEPCLVHPVQRDIQRGNRQQPVGKALRQGSRLPGHVLEVAGGYGRIAILRHMPEDHRDRLRPVEVPAPDVGAVRPCGG